MKVISLQDLFLYFFDMRSYFLMLLRNHKNHFQETLKDLFER